MSMEAGADELSNWNKIEQKSNEYADSRAKEIIQEIRQELERLPSGVKEDIDIYYLVTRTDGDRNYSGLIAQKLLNDLVGESINDKLRELRDRVNSGEPSLGEQEIATFETNVPGITYVVKRHSREKQERGDFSRKDVLRLSQGN